MSTTHPLIRLVLLPLDPSRPATCLHVDRDGHVSARHVVPPGHALAAVAAGTRDIVAVPGEAVTLLWLELPARHPLQARAAARLRLEAHVAVPVEGLHIALGPTAGPGTACMIAVTANTRMDEWKQRCEALGATAAAWVPDYLLLDAPDGERVHAMALDGRLLVRGQECAFSGPPALAHAIVGDGLMDLLPAEDNEARLARAAARTLPMDLLQFEHALPDTHAIRQRRRRLLLAAAVVLSPLLLAGAQTLRDLALAGWMNHRADVVARQVLPGGSNEADPSTTLQALYRQRIAPSQLATHSNALFDIIKQHPGSRLDSYEFDASGGLRVGLLHRDEQDLEAMRIALQSGGLSMVPLESGPVEGGMRSLLNVEALP